ncbi:MAG TPA: hypothetical protein VF103_11160 [Polyangiaceae bacterium]
MSPLARSSQRLGLTVALLAVPGCVSYGSHLTAKPTPPGTSEYSVNVDGLIIDRGLGPQVLPNPEASMRWGVSRNVDFGVRVNTLGAEASSRIALLRLDSYELTSVPLLGGGFVPATNEDTGLVTTTAGVMLLNGVELGAETSLVLGLRSQMRLELNAVAVEEDFSAANWSFVPGGSLGVRFPLGRRLFLFPELVIAVPRDLERGVWKFPVFQGGVAVQWGSR